MANSVRLWMLPVLAANLLTACATANSDLTCSCPPIKTYSKSVQQQMADEIDMLPADSVLVAAMQDYALLRQQIRACH